MQTVFSDSDCQTPLNFGDPGIQRLCALCLTAVGWQSSSSCVARFYTSASKTAPPTALHGCFPVDIECNILRGGLCEVHPPLPFSAVVVISVRRLCPRGLCHDRPLAWAPTRWLACAPRAPCGGRTEPVAAPRWPSPPPASTSCPPFSLPSVRICIVEILLLLGRRRGRGASRDATRRAEVRRRR